MNRKEILENYYSEWNEDDRLLSRFGQVEFLTTIRYVEKYLKPEMKILEIGAGTGRYSHYFARKGYAVDAVELVETNIEGFKKKTLPNEEVNIYQGDAVNLHMLNEDFLYYTEYIYSICERADMIGMSGHLLDIFEKK